MHAPSSRARGGYSLVELVVVLTIMAMVAFAGLHELQLLLDGAATRAAVGSAARVVARARDEAVALQTPVSVRIDTVTAALELVTRYGAFGRAALGQQHGVTISTTRDSITFDVRGLGYGAANLTLVTRRGRATDTLVVSRLGRTRY